MVARNRPTRRVRNAEPADTDFLTKAAQMVGTALGSISVKVRGKQSDGEPKVNETAQPKPARKPAARKRATRKTGTKASSQKRKSTSVRAKKGVKRQR